MTSIDLNQSRGDRQRPPWLGAKTIERWSMYRHILIPTDGSELAERAVTHGLSLAKFVGAKVTVIVVEERLAGWWSFAETGTAEAFDKYTEQIKKYNAS